MSDGNKEGRLCSYCLGIFPIKGDEREYTVQHHPNIEELLSAADGCHLCKIIEKYWPLDYLRKRFPDITEDRYRNVLLTLQFSAPHCFTTGISWVLVYIELHTPEHAFTAHSRISITTCDLGGPAAEHPLWHTLRPSVADKHATIKAWLTECQSQHLLCTPPTDTDPPKRLIDVGSVGSPLRLVHTSSDIGKHWIYATLSHCWGDHRPLILTTENERSFTDQIPWDLLPKTFQEAIDIARAVGIRYLWIDSLCIAQDDEIEWRHEAHRMRNVYFGSALTICASDGDNSLAGCFVSRDELSPCPEREEVTQFSTTLLEEGSSLRVRIQSGDARSRRESGPLAQRGWTLQEQVMGRRVLYCTNPEMQWHCRCTFLTEAGVSFDERSQTELSIKALPLIGSPAQFHEAWCQWMEEYSQRKLTFPRDRFAALAGITLEYAVRSGHKHLLGCWEQTLAKDLLWLAFEVEEASALQSGVPSWSWLSRYRDVSYDHWSWKSTNVAFDVVDHIKVVEVDVSWVDIPLLTDIKHTRLVLRGPVQVFKLHVSPLARDFRPPYFDVGDEEPDFSKSPIPWYCSGRFDDGHERDAAAYPCLLMRTRTPTKRNNVVSHETFMILELVSVGNSTIETYRRIGLGHFRSVLSKFGAACEKDIALI